tara:strand:+ start:312 stop:812 length:501 start_codon:yes stop_codon:yes gene_type:complete
MNIYELYTKKYNLNESAEDYVKWAYNALVNGYDSEQLRILSSYDNNSNLFEVSKVFDKVIMECNIAEPSQEECLLFKALRIAIEIRDREVDLVEKAKEMFYILVELEYSEKLMEWYWVSEDIDASKYDLSRKDLTEEKLHSIIRNQAEKSVIELSKLIDDKELSSE